MITNVLVNFGRKRNETQSRRIKESNGAMKSIEERAKVASDRLNRNCYIHMNENTEDAYKDGYVDGATEQRTIDCAKAYGWLMSHYHEYFALRKPISEFENDFTTAMTTEK